MSASVRKSALPAAGAAVALAATGIVGVLAATPATAASAAATSGWAPTGTHALTLTNATSLGSAAAATPLRLTIGLTPQNKSGLTSLIKAQNTPGSAQYEQYLSPSAFAAQFGATQAAATAVTNYLTAQGMQNVTVASNRLLVTADATVAQADKAFNTAISSFKQAGKTVLANTGAASVPTALAGQVDGVLGLSTLGASSPLPPVSTPKLTGYYPKEFSTVYDAGKTSTGSGSQLAVIAEGNLAPTIADLRTAEAKQNLPQVPVNLYYAGMKSTDTSGADEWDLDTQTSTGVAPNVSALDIYVATSLSDSDLARAIGLFVSQDVAQAGSASLGECDVLPFLDGAMTVDDMLFAEAAAQGQTFFASSGDTGSACAVEDTNGVPGSGLPDTEYPASSPYVLGVGGTTLDTSSTDAYQTEIAWNAGGGGISPVENAPYWQSGVVPTAAAGLRGVPDDAFDADPNTGAQIYVSGTPTQIGGTSLASPLALGLWTRINATHSNKLGFAPPKLYGLYTKAKGSSQLPPKSVPGFHDIVLGVNGAYTALPGWDYTTGLGSWDVAKLSTALS